MSKLTNEEVNKLIGTTIGELTIIEFSHRAKGNIYYKCKCSCGNECIKTRNYLLDSRRNNISCGHLSNQLKNDLTGKVFGRLTVISYSHTNKNGCAYYNCQCICGNTKTVRRDALVKGRTVSCGCYSSEVHSNLMSTKEGLSKTRLYKIWQHMKDRCYNTNSDNYNNYGERGIFICNSWLDDFMNFYNDMSEEYYKMSEIYGEKFISIDRIDNNDGYYKENCRWATKSMQQNNRRNNRIVTICGEEMTLQQAIDKYALPELSYNAVRDRLECGWDILNALKVPLDTTRWTKDNNINTRRFAPLVTSPIRFLH